MTKYEVAFHHNAQLQFGGFAANESCNLYLFGFPVLPQNSWNLERKRRKTLSKTLPKRDRALLPFTHKGLSCDLFSATASHTTIQSFHKVRSTNFKAKQNENLFLY
jgi:hypothetical protein